MACRGEGRLDNPLVVVDKLPEGPGLDGLAVPPIAEGRDNLAVAGWVVDAPIEGLEEAAGRGRPGATAEVRGVASCLVGDFVGD